MSAQGPTIGYGYRDQYDEHEELERKSKLLIWYRNLRSRFLPGYELPVEEKALVGHGYVCIRDDDPLWDELTKLMWDQKTLRDNDE
jgi:hypothetical protein